MKPRFLLTTAFLAMILVYLPVDASFNINLSTQHMEITILRAKAIAVPPIDPSLPIDRHPMMGVKDKPNHPGDKPHSEEDGKHHHFHMDRVKRIRRFCNIFCVITKCFLTITHICIIISVFKAVFAH